MLLSWHIRDKCEWVPYVGMAQKQDGSSNGCIGNYMYNDNNLARSECYTLWGTFPSFSTTALANQTTNITTYRQHLLIHVNKLYHTFAAPIYMYMYSYVHVYYMSPK